MNLLINQISQYQIPQNISCKIKKIPTPSSQASNVLRIFFGEQREYAIYTKQFHILFWGQGQGMPFSGTIIPVALRCGLIEFNN